MEHEWQWQFLLGKSSTNRPLSKAISNFQTVGPFMSCFISICPRSMLRLSQATSEACPHQLMPDEWGKSSHCCSWTNVVEISWACWCSWIHSPASFVKKTSKGWSRNLSSPTQEQYLPTPLLGGSCPMLLVDVQGSQTLSNFITIHLARPSLYLYTEIGKNTHSFGCFFLIPMATLRVWVAFQKKAVAPSRTSPRFGFDTPSTSFVPHVGCPCSERSQHSVDSAVNPVRVES